MMSTSKQIMNQSEYSTNMSVVGGSYSNQLGPKNSPMLNHKPSLRGGQFRPVYKKYHDELDSAGAYDQSSYYPTMTQQEMMNEALKIQQKVKSNRQQLGSTSISTGGYRDTHRGGKLVALINMVPMQDYQLEKWRQAYHSKEAAVKHF